MTEPSTPTTALRVGSQPIGDRALNWWSRYCDPASRDRDTSVRSRLQRCRDPVEVLTIAPAILLARQVGALRPGRDDNDPRLIAAVSLARVLAHIKEHSSMAPLRAAGWKTFPNDGRESDVGAERPRLSEARFRRLIETGPGEEQVAAFVRLIRLLDGAVNVSAIAVDFLDWSHPVRRQRVRQRWAFDYYAAGSAAPVDPPVSEDDE